jgi:simple sugar transport system ATP-binding protein
MDKITKSFPGVVANDNVSFTLKPGEVHALVGENGAGKTTLMKILYGLYGPDSGEIRIHGQAETIRTSRDAIHKGIGMVHQHFMLVPIFNALENIVLGEEKAARRQAEELERSRDGSVSLWQRFRRSLTVDMAGARRRVEELMKKNGIELDLDAPIEELPVGVQQRVEILKILYRGAEILVFDEPTAVLTPQEVTDLFETFRELKDQGKGIIFISHKLDEVLNVADRISVLRRGKMVETLPAEGATKSHIAELMVGKPVLLKVDNPPAEPGRPVLELRDLTIRSERGTTLVDKVSLDVRAGEIYGIAGVEGNGQSALLRAIALNDSVESGDILLEGRSVLKDDVRRRRELGMSHIPDDRGRFGLIMPFSIADNITLGRHHLKPFASELQVIRKKDKQAFARQAIDDYDIRTPDEQTPALALSGGNQQKVIIARELSADPVLLLASQPTRGVDVGATEFIYKQIVEAKKQGRAVLLVSADLDEIMSLSDRIGVMYRGRIVREFRAGETSKDEVGYYMMGAEEHGEVSV